MELGLVLAKFQNNFTIKFIVVRYNYITTILVKLPV